MNINTCLISPFSPGDKVDISRHHTMQDARVTNGVVTDCKKTVDPDSDGLSLWMVYITLDNGRRLGVRPSYVDLIKD
jgi:hypothetical protein